jgi:hypothetical protein
MCKSLQNSLECPDRLADRLEGHRFGVAAMSTIALVAALCMGNYASVRAEERAAQWAHAVATQEQRMAFAASSGTEKNPIDQAAIETNATLRAAHRHEGNPKGTANARFSVPLTELPN